MRQSRLMSFDPVTCKAKPYPSMAAQYRTYHKSKVWKFNPWTGVERSSLELETDPEGLLITLDYVPTGKPIKSKRTKVFKVTKGTANGTVVDPMVKLFINAAANVAPEKMPKWAEELQSEYAQKLLDAGVKLK